MPWQSQKFWVEGKQFTFENMCDGRGKSATFLHGSIHEIQVGDIIRPGIKESNYLQSPTNTVCLTSDTIRAASWARDGRFGTEKVWIYEVLPLCPVTLHRVGLSNYGKGFTLWEGRVPRAEVVSAKLVEYRTLLP